MTNRVRDFATERDRPLIRRCWTPGPRAAVDSMSTFCQLERGHQVACEFVRDRKSKYSQPWPAYQEATACAH